MKKLGLAICSIFVLSGIGQAEPVDPMDMRELQINIQPLIKAVQIKPVTLPKIYGIDPRIQQLFNSLVAKGMEKYREAEPGVYADEKVYYDEQGRVSRIVRYERVKNKDQSGGRRWIYTDFVYDEAGNVIGYDQTIIEKGWLPDPETGKLVYHDNRVTKISVRYDPIKPGAGIPGQGAAGNEKDAKADRGVGQNEGLRPLCSGDPSLCGEYLEWQAMYPELDPMEFWMHHIRFPDREITPVSVERLPLPGDVTRNRTKTLPTEEERERRQSMSSQDPLFRLR